MEVSEVALFSNARNLSSHQSQDNLSQNIILPIEQTTFYWESDCTFLVSFLSLKKHVWLRLRKETNLKSEYSQTSDSVNTKNHHFID